MNKQAVLVTTSSFAKDNTLPLDKLQPFALDVILNPKGRKLTEKEVLQMILDHQPVGMIAGVEPLTARVLGEAKNLKAIARAGIGMDSVDLEAAEKLAISVSNTPDAPTIPVAELTLGMILSLLRGIHVSDQSIRQGEWERPMGNLLFGKTVGIIGCGRIGSRLAKYLLALECELVGCDPACQLHESLEIVELDALLAKSDIVSLHLPYSPQTHHFMNRDRIQAMKAGSYLINAARGGLVDEEALFQALSSGHLAGAALDCYEQEPYTDPLKDLKNALLTAHIGSYAKEARVMMETQAADNLVKQLKDKGVL